MKHIRLNRKNGSWMQASMILLLSVFMLLSFCPVRKSLYSLINENPNPIESKAAGINKTVLPASGQKRIVLECSTWQSGILSTDLPAKFVFPIIPAVFALFLFPTAFFISSVFHKILLREILEKYLQTVPIHIRNRVLLI